MLSIYNRRKDLVIKLLKIKLLCRLLQPKCRFARCQTSLIDLKMQNIR